MITDHLFRPQPSKTPLEDMAPDELVLIKMEIRRDRNSTNRLSPNQRVTSEPAFNPLLPSFSLDQLCKLGHGSRIVIDRSVREGIAPEPFDCTHMITNQTANVSPPIWSEPHVSIYKRKPISVNARNEVLASPPSAWKIRSQKAMNRNPLSKMPFEVGI